jgi:hypothetical protein
MMGPYECAANPKLEPDYIGGGVIETYRLCNSKNKNGVCPDYEECKGLITKLREWIRE